MQTRALTLAAILVLLIALVVPLALFAWPEPAAACGCLSPPLPDANEAYAVNQQSEQIIFEVNENTTTAHVLIRYAGEPESFGWMVPVRGVPELGLSPGAIFGMLDQLTRPTVTVQRKSVCPEHDYECTYHSPCSGTRDGDGGSPSPGGLGGLGTSDGGAASAPGGAGDVTIFGRQQIGAYDTVIIGSQDAQAAGRWLNANGFIVNETMGPYMQPYLDEGFNFVASKLVPGAGVDEIKPLRITYAGTEPMIPLRITAVAAEPHLTVTAYIYGTSRYTPTGTRQPTVVVPDEALSVDRSGRSNYPMVLARVIDEAGGHAFVQEFYDVAPRGLPDPGGCCSGDFDRCRLANNSRCECPGSLIDAVDCAGKTDLIDSTRLLAELAGRHPVLTRLTTRVSPEEMSEDPMFGPERNVSLSGRRVHQGMVRNLDACGGDVIDTELRRATEERQACASIYCGTGECVVTTGGVGGCVCFPGTVARTFSDYDGLPSVTCVPETPSVDLGAGGIFLRNPCTTARLERGACFDLGGFPATRCEPGTAAVVRAPAPEPRCAAVVRRTDSPGAQDYSSPLESVRVCAPRPPVCAASGWLVPVSREHRRGALCAGREPAPEALVPTPAPVCTAPGDGGGAAVPRGDGGAQTTIGGGGCTVGASTMDDAGSAMWLIALMSLALAAWGVRRRRAHAR